MSTQARQMFKEFDAEYMTRLLNDIEKCFGASSSHAIAFDCLVEDAAKRGAALRLTIEELDDIMDQKGHTARTRDVLAQARKAFQ